MDRDGLDRQTDRVTISNIAERAGVSLTTVSRALNDKPDISPTTKARILQIIEELGYSPSTLARSLATRRTYTIGMAVRTIADMWVVEVVPTIEEVLRHAGYEVFLSTHYADAEQEDRVVETFRRRQVDGIIVLSSARGPGHTAIQEEVGIPIVLVSPLKETAHRHVVRTDDVSGARTATEHLIALGHRRIGHIGAPEWTLPGQDRLAGYRLALEAHGIPYDPALVYLGDAHEQQGREGMQALLSRPSPPTAVNCFNDLTAVGALRGVRSAGLSVPEDVSLIGFDDVPLAGYVHPPLSTVRQNMHALGQRASQMLLDLIQGRDPGGPIELETNLVQRSSTAPLRTEVA